MDETKPENRNQNDDDATTKTTTNQQQFNDNKKRKKNECAVFGNYRYYYSYRIDEGLDEDPRVNVLKKEWFQGKDCLDIGCNSGVVTVNIAEKFGCRSMLGIDIDSARIDDAYWNLRRVISRKSHKKDSKRHRTKDAGLLGGKESVSTLSSTERSEDSVDAFSPDLSKIVMFRKGNIVEDRCFPEKTHFDTILCFSVTKWIHLNWGDDGLIAMFAKIWKLLKPGGVFVLEAQPWKSYSKKHVVSEVARTNYQKIEIFPKDFQEILLDKIGFRMIENLSSNLSGSKSGFKRPILALWK